MKRILFFAALVLGMVSCMKDQSFDADLAGDGNFVVSVALPDDATRAAGVDSSKGAIANNVLEKGYEIRYTLEVYDANGALAKEADKTVNQTSTSFELRLIPGRHYRFVVWADFVKAGVAYYNVDDLRDVKLSGEHNAMNESRDAYTAVYNTATEGEGNKFSSASKIEMTLTRPFAKLRVVTNDMNELYANLKSATVKYTTPIYT
ncbi:MAG: FimB/Mfa2 family fimbrial subunit, partial [Alistipes sp.]|nr:FimB/Mfa2 family fimbrial subunit [Alistipes sp.]